MREKHGVEHRGRIKVHIAVDVETKKPVAFEITDERITDQKMVGALFKDVNLDDALMDGAYDKEEVYKILKDKSVYRPGINLRKDAIIRHNTVRGESILEHEKLGHNSWKKVHLFDQRWAAESVFSAIKRIYGEAVRATSKEGMLKEVRRQIAFYTITLSL